MIERRGKSAFIAAVAVLILASNVATGQSGAGATKSSQADSAAGSKLPGVAYFSKAEVDANFEHPKAMDDSIYLPDYGSRNFKVKTSKRTKTIAAEVHTQWTDAIYVVKGSATAPRTVKTIRPAGVEVSSASLNDTKSILSA